MHSNNSRQAGISMSDTKKQTAELIREHGVIVAHMKSLTNSLKSMATEPGTGAARSAPLRDQIRLYRWSLYDFREAIRRIIALDDRILETLRGSATAEGVMGEHSEIQGKLDKAIRLAEDAVYKDLGRTELNHYAVEIKETVTTLCRLIEMHIAEENRLFQSVLKD